MDEEVTRLLKAWGNGIDGAADDLFPLIYEELRRVARRHCHGPDATVHPTALVHQTFIEMADAAKTDWRDRKQFFAFAAVVMRRLAVTEARRKLASKRGELPDVERFDEELHSCLGFPAAQATDIAELDDALTRLEALDADQARIVELRYFAGLSVEETAECLNISPRTVAREWGMAKSWLASQLRPLAQ